MNTADKEEYHDSLIKNMTRKCHNKCFNSTNSNIDSNCVSSCYHKYINVISQLRKLAYNKGVEYQSEFVSSAFSTRENPLMDLIWARDGSKYMPFPFVSLSLRHLNGHKIYPYKGYSPFRDPMENQ